MRTEKSVSMKAVVLLLVVVLLIGGAVGGTMAWLIAGTKTVTNTFTVGDIDIDLTETVGETEKSALTEDVFNDNFKMVPGTDLEKDPKVTVEGGSEACWLFVKVTAANGVIPEGTSSADAYITYGMAEGWTPVDGSAGVFYRQVSASSEDQPFGILKDNKVHVLETVTKEMMETAKKTKPSLAFTAYAIQQEGLKDGSGNAVNNAAAAWSLINTEE